ncbi:hypothetical protein PsorP6_005000 [Peronosclerospora sorghi]|uniref:Uncharacterized protein n=1 Tax=Peronosclerospora sorghi TaxID=230839 RepID=A0ACC0W5H6_9STRA|nr:hypothetical protein PsorP6_005000 [Peronosclerospora sorghi]
MGLERPQLHWILASVYPLHLFLEQRDLISQLLTISLFFAGSGGSSSRQLGNGIANGMSNRAERRRHKTNGYSLFGFHEPLSPSKHLQH